MPNESKTDRQTPPAAPEAPDLTAEQKKTHKPVEVEVIHRNGRPYKGSHRPLGTPLTVPQYVLDGNPEFIKERA
jgi:hypothetical protein